MAKGDIELSPKYGVNPSITLCFFCMKEMGIALMGKLKGDAEAPRKICLDHTPCDECAEYMKMGIILISVDEAKTEDKTNPYRTGGWVVVKEEAIANIVKDEELKKSILHDRVAFVPDEAWEMLGLPRAPEPTEESDVPDQG